MQGPLEQFLGVQLAKAFYAYGDITWQTAKIFGFISSVAYLSAVNLPPL
jgi:hypothetical protein